jgi:spermidine/putrescine-binding protein
LIEEGLAAELNQARIPNLKNLDPDFHTNVFDPGSRHAIPYLWSTAGIAYNFDQLDHIPHSWGDLLIPDPPHQAQLTGRISLLPGPVRAIAAALLHLGHSPNENATNNLEAAGQLLERQMGTLHFRFLGTKLVNALDHGDILMAEAYSSEAERARRHNPHINFALPEDGVWLTIDHLVIPKATDARHQALAETFINYLLDPVVAAKVVNYSFHATTVSEARAFVDAEIRLGPPYSRPNHIVVQTFDREGDAYRQLLWRRLTNAFNVPAAL